MVASGPETLKSSEKLFALVDALLELGEAGVTELAEHVSFHKSTVYVHLQTMRENGFVNKSGDKYRLSLHFLTIAEAIKNQHAVYRNGSVEIDRLAEETGELVCLGIPEDGSVVVVHEAQGEKTTQSISVGTKMPLTETAMGKVILAFATGSEDGGDRPPGDDEFAEAVGAVDSDHELATEIAAIRRDGYLVSGGEFDEEMPYIAEPDVGKPRSESHHARVQNRTVAAPIRADGRPVGAVTVTGPANRLSDEYLDDVRQQVISTADEIRQKLTVTQRF
ncbi:IclR family transcriptional regulator [Halosimplex amylolyticum]|uniref:IclR family transcriptional regulator n=1 Tax=Halosimplex amylolyticum TaxID=3396616 RepID=UPI003F56476E